MAINMADTLQVLTIIRDSAMTEKLLTTLKTLGHPVRHQAVEDLATLIDVLQNHDSDLIFNDMDFDSLPLAEVIEAVRLTQRNPGIISLDPDNRHKVTEALATGAYDLIKQNDLEHLKLVVKRCLGQREEHRRLQQLKNSFTDLEKLYATLMETYEAPVAYLHEGIHVQANQAYRALFEVRPDEDLEGIPLMDLLPESERPVIKAFLQRHKRGDTADDNTQHVQIGDTEHIMEIADVYYDGEPCQQVIIRPLPSNEETSQLTEQFNYLAIYDIASGLYTRNHLIEQLDNVIAEQAGSNEFVEERPALIMLSLDNYRDLAAGIGLAEADLLYSEVGAELKGHLSLDDILCRYDDHTYCLLTSPITESAAVQLTRSLLDTTTPQLFDINGNHVPCQLSAGLARVDENSVSAYQVISAALESLHLANLKGVDFDDEWPQPTQKPQRIIDQEWTEKMRGALKEGHFRLFYQPIIDLHGETRDTYNVSVKIANPDDSYDHAADFMPSAERTGYAKGIDHWVVDEAFRTISELAERDDSHPVLFIKLTQGTLYHEEDISWIRRQLEACAIDSRQLVFEINTSSLINHLQQTRKLIADLKPLGCRFAVDDFGTSLNPFQILRHVEIDFLKIAASLTRDIDTNDNHQQLLSYIAHQAHEQGQQVIAQQVEHADQFFLLKDLGVDFIQGDFISKPTETLRFDFEFPQ